MTKYWLLILFICVSIFSLRAENSEQTVFLGERLQEDGKLILDLSTILQKQKNADEALLNIFSKSGGNPDSVEDTRVRVDPKLLQSLLPAALLEQRKHFRVVLDSIVFDATGQDFVAVKSEVAPELNIHLELTPAKEVSLSAYQQSDFLIASTAPLSDPVVFSQAEMKDQTARDVIKSFFKKAKLTVTDEMAKVARKTKHTEEEKELLSTYKDFKKEPSTDESIFLSSASKSNYFYVSYMCTEGRGFSGLFRYYPADKHVETLIPLQFSSYCPSHAVDSNLIEVDVNEDHINEIFFRVTYFEGSNLQGYQKDNKTGLYKLLIETAYAGV
jgi:hypothetical protein